MNSKLNKINEAISDIRETLNAECANISDLPGLVSELAKNASSGGFTTTFAFSSTGSSKPTASMLDTSTGLVIDLEEEWSQIEINKNSDRIYLSFATFDNVGIRKTDWSVPINIKGERGSKGDTGADGATGEPGAKGDKGEDGKVYRTVMVYTRTDSTETPLKPMGGYWNVNTNSFTNPTASDGNIWSYKSEETEDKKYLWISESSFDQNGENSGWSEPMRLTGDDGKAGADGRVTEFIYRILPNIETYNDLRDWLDAHLLVSENEDNVVPEKNDYLYSSDWTDSPTGITSLLPIEVVCTRTRKSINESWGPWSNCMIWAKWGEDGTDGDGVEYIYLVTPSEINGEKITPDHVRTLLMPSLSEAATREDYQNEEFCFNDEWGYPGYDWKDEPSDVGPNKPIEWVSVRKRINGVWGLFSDPSIWATHSKDGKEYKTSFVFKRSSSKPDVPIGGDFSRPYPDTKYGWEDTIPSGTDPVYISTRTFCNPSDDFDSSWSDPKMMADSAEFQVEYTASEVVSNIDHFNGDEASWRLNQESKYGIKWGDDSEITDPIWMATCNRPAGGDWTNWTITRIKGEKGDKGNDGTSVSISFKCNTKEELLAEWTNYVNGESFFGKNTDLKIGEGCYVQDEGNLYVYNGGYYPGEDITAFEAYWSNVGNIKGEDGTSSYVYIRYSASGLSSDVLYEIPGTNTKWIGIAYSDRPYNDIEKNTYSNYMWSKYQGEDGFGQEQIFLATTKEYDPAVIGKSLPLPENKPEYNVREALPTHNLGSQANPSNKWSDTPVQISEEYPYCWVATRSVVGSEFGEWKGNNGYAVLYSRYSYDGADGINGVDGKDGEPGKDGLNGKDGVSAYSISLDNDFATIPTEGGKLDSDFKDEISTTVRLYYGDEPVDAEEYSVKSNEWGSVDPNNNIRFILAKNKLNNLPTSVPVEIEFKDKTYTRTWNIKYSDNTYRLNVNTYVIKKNTVGDRIGYLEKDKIFGYLYQWDGKQYLFSNHSISANVYFDNGDISVAILNPENGYWELELSEYKNVSRIELTVQDKTGDVLEKETIGIVADGINGVNGGKFEVMLYPDMISVPIDGNNVDSDFDNASSTITVYSDGLPIEFAQVVATVDESYTDYISIDENGVVTILDYSILNTTDRIPITVTATWDEGLQRTVDWKFYKTQQSYSIVVSESILYQDEFGDFIDGNNSVVAYVKKWDGSKYVNNYTKDVFVEVDGEVGKGYNRSENEYTFNNEISTIKFYITDNNLEDGNIIHEESIGIIKTPQSSVSVELSPDYLTIPVDNNVVDYDFTGGRSEIHVFYGNTEVTSELSEKDFNLDPAVENMGVEIVKDGNGWYIQWTPNDTVISDVTFSVSYKECSPRYTTWRMIKSSEAYYINVDDDLIFSENNVLKENVSGTIQKWSVDKYVPVSTTVKCKFDNGDESLTAESDSEGKFTFELNEQEHVNLKKITISIETESGLIISENVKVYSDGIDGINALTSFVFTRSVNIPTKPDSDEGSWITPKPDSSSIWKDSVPNGIEPLYMSMRTFKSDGAHDPEWSEPQLISDSSDIQYEFTKTSISANYKPENLGNHNGNISAWRTAESAKGISWYDSLSDPVFMAVAKYSNGKWGDWSVSRIKGETGGISEDQWDTVNQSISDYATQSVENSLGTVKSDLEEARAKLGSLLNDKDATIDSLLEAYAETHRLEETASAMDTLKGYFDNDGKLSQSHLSQGAIANLVNAAASGKQLNAQYLATLVADVIELNADRITAGTLDCNNIAVENLKASSITAGQIKADQIDFGSGILSGGTATNQVNKIVIGSKSEMENSKEQNVLFIVI